MGIDAHALHLLRRARAKHGALGNTVTLGRQVVFLERPDIRRWLGDREELRRSYCEPLLKEYFGATDVDSVDNSNYEQASIIHDMNLPLPEAMRQRYDTVLDFGCLEHIFDVAQSVRNVTGLCKIGGRILHVLPANGYCGHGFYQFSAEFFFSCYSENNGFSDTEVYFGDLLDSQHWYRVSPPRDGKRINIRSGNEVYVLAITRRTSEASLAIQQSDYLHAWAADAGADVVAPALPVEPTRRDLSVVRAALQRVPGVGRIVHAVNSALSDQSHRPLRGHPALERLRTDDLEKW